METVSALALLVEQELLRFTEPGQRERARALLVPPRCEQRAWDYGEKGQSFPCWIVAEHLESGTAFAWCVQGFGPKNPWGLLHLSLSSPCASMGMDCSWFPHLDACIRDSFAWEEIR